MYVNSLSGLVVITFWCCFFFKRGGNQCFCEQQLSISVGMNCVSEGLRDGWTWTFRPKLQRNRQVQTDWGVLFPRYCDSINTVPYLEYSWEKGMMWMLNEISQRFTLYRLSSVEWSEKIRPDFIIDSPEKEKSRQRRSLTKGKGKGKFVKGNWINWFSQISEDPPLFFFFPPYTYIQRYRLPHLK